MIGVDGREAISGFAFLPTPGHTPNHASIVFRSGDDVAPFPGAIAQHPEQIARPALFSDCFAWSFD